MFFQSVKNNTNKLREDYDYPKSHIFEHGITYVNRSNIPAAAYLQHYT